MHGAQTSAGACRWWCGSKRRGGGGCRRGGSGEERGRRLGITTWSRKGGIHAHRPWVMFLFSCLRRRRWLLRREGFHFFDQRVPPAFDGSSRDNQSHDLTVVTALVPKNRVSCPLLAWRACVPSLDGGLADSARMDGGVVGGGIHDGDACDLLASGTSGSLFRLSSAAIIGPRSANALVIAPPTAFPTASPSAPAAASAAASATASLILAGSSCNSLMIWAY